MIAFNRLSFLASHHVLGRPTLHPRILLLKYRVANMDTSLVSDIGCFYLQFYLVAVSRNQLSLKSPEGLYLT